MAKLVLERYADLLRYNQAEGRLSVVQLTPPWALTPALDWQPALAELASLDAQAGVFGAAYALAATAHEWRGRPTEARRGAIIQVAQQLHALDLLDPANLLGLALERADAALLAGEDAEQSITALIGEHLRRAERAADRCGRRAAALLDAGDQVVVYGFGGPPLLALLGALPALDPAPALRIAGAGAGPQLLADLANTAGFAATSADQPDLFSAELPGLCLVTAVAIGADGGAVCPHGSGVLIANARQRSIPCYLLAPSGLADEHTPVIDLGLVGGDIILPDLVSAIITDRGIYRPAMIGRYHGDADTPLDVIALN